LPLLEAVRSTAFPGLYVVGAGSGPEMLTVKMASKEMVALIQDATKDFDHVVIDTPPVLAMADAGLLASVVDGVVLVAGAGVSSLGMVQQASADLQRAGGTVLGVVLNCARSSHTPPMPGAVRFEDYLSQKPAAAAGHAAKAAHDTRPDRVDPSRFGGARSGAAAQKSAENTTIMEVR
jgi:Mrp family chromosome partitioning ATPase